MFRLLGLFLGTLVRIFRSRRSLFVENLALRQQISVLKRRHPRPRLTPFDRLFWVTARRAWSSWKQSLIIVTPEAWFAGTELGSASIGAFSPGFAAAPAERESLKRFVP